MAYGSQDHGDRGSRCEQVFTHQERLSLRLARHRAEAQARLPIGFEGDGFSVRAPLARKLVHANGQGAPLKTRSAFKSENLAAGEVTASSCRIPSEPSRGVLSRKWQPLHSPRNT
jgi:hypothetical protein